MLTNASLLRNYKIKYYLKKNRINYFINNLTEKSKLRKALELKNSAVQENN